jgi:hypothetical protein
MLQAIADNIWLVEGGIVSFYGFPYPTRAMIVRFGNGDLWLWSPVKLSEELRREVDGLGRVAHLVSPNKIHHLFLGEWKDAYPEAKLWGPASTIAKRSDLQFEAALQDVPARAVAAGHRPGVVPRLVRHGRGRVLACAFAHGGPRRPDRELLRRLPARALVVVAAAAGAARRHHGAP